MSAHPNDQLEAVEFTCRCGKVWRQSVRHYDVVLCRCGGRVWALRPKRGGPLVGFPHPGARPGTMWETVG